MTKEIYLELARELIDMKQIDNETIELTAQLNECSEQKLMDAIEELTKK
jgi:hypothetical protein